jgi:hypothetical protein
MSSSSRKPVSVSSYVQISPKKKPQQQPLQQKEPLPLKVASSSPLKRSGSKSPLDKGSSSSPPKKTPRKSPDPKKKERNPDKPKSPLEITTNIVPAASETESQIEKNEKSADAVSGGPAVVSDKADTLNPNTDTDTCKKDTFAQDKDVNEAKSLENWIPAPPLTTLTPESKTSGHGHSQDLDHHEVIASLNSPSSSSSPANVNNNNNNNNNIVSLVLVSDAKSKEMSDSASPVKNPPTAAMTEEKLPLISTSSNENGPQVSVSAETGLPSAAVSVNLITSSTTSSA